MSYENTRVSRSSHTYAMVSTALMAAVTCILAPFSIPIGPEIRQRMESAVR